MCKIEQSTVDNAIDVLQCSIIIASELITV